MHNPWEENYERGYEWFLLSEAKKRNPNIKTYGLSWAYPEWVTCVPGTMDNCTDSIYTYPNQTARYITKWIGGAKNTYGVDIDYSELLFFVSDGVLVSSCIVVHQVCIIRNDKLTNSITINSLISL